MREVWMGTQGAGMQKTQSMISGNADGMSLQKIGGRTRFSSALGCDWSSSSGNTVVAIDNICTPLGWVVCRIVLYDLAYRRIQRKWYFASEWREGTWTCHWEGSWAEEYFCRDAEVRAELAYGFLRNCKNTELWATEGSKVRLRMLTVSCWFRKVNNWKIRSISLWIWMSSLNHTISGEVPYLSTIKNGTIWASELLS